MRIRYFAWLKARVGTAEETVEPPPEVRTVAELQAWLAEDRPGLKEALASRGVVRCAIDQRYVEPETPLEGAAEVAFFPPVTGG